MSFQGSATVIDLAARRGKPQPTTTREQLFADTLEFLLNRAIDLKVIAEAEGKTVAEIRMELFEATMLGGLFGEAGYEAVKLAVGVMDEPESA